MTYISISISNDILTLNKNTEKCPNRYKDGKSLTYDLKWAKPHKLYASMPGLETQYLFCSMYGNKKGMFSSIKEPGWKEFSLPIKEWRKRQERILIFLCYDKASEKTPPKAKKRHLSIVSLKYILIFKILCNFYNGHTT